MLIFNDVKIDKILTRDNPLYVGHFFSLSGMWWKKRKIRQNLIISIATTWYKLLKDNPNATFIKREIYLTKLYKQVSDAKVVLEHFFKIDQIGYNFNNGTKSPTLVTPKKLSKIYIDVIENLLSTIYFEPEKEPTNENLICSSVSINKLNYSIIRQTVINKNRIDLLPMVDWLYKQESIIKFYYTGAGSLQLRDKCVWPIKGIEQWPGWLRSSIFGRQIDLEGAYCQFLIKNLEDKYKDNTNIFELNYFDLIKLETDKINYREEICIKYLKLSPTKENIKILKNIIMSIANGSNISSGLLLANSTQSECVRIIKENCQHLNTTELINLGNRLAILNRQFKLAKKDLCIFFFNQKPTRENQKKIFKKYLEWERKARYSIWNTSGKSGLMMHDGLDGVINDLTSNELVNLIVAETLYKVSVN